MQFSFKTKSKDDVEEVTEERVNPRKPKTLKTGKPGKSDNGDSK